MQPQLNDFLSQGDALRQLLGQLERDELFHALLLTGERGTGKRTLARLIAQALLCTASGPRPCGECAACLQTEKEEHPDLTVVHVGQPLAPDGKKDRPTIPVEDIREVIRLAETSSFAGGKRVLVITEAEKMTPAAQNCLLKTLEEPPEDACFILISEKPELLLTTVLSRCRRVNLHAWPDEMLLRLLRDRGVEERRALASVQAAKGSVGEALKLSGDEAYWQLRREILKQFFDPSGRSEILKISTAWKDRKAEAGVLFAILELLLNELLHDRFEPEKATLMDDFSPSWVNFAQKAPIESFCRLSDCLLLAKKQCQSAVNFQAVLEQVLFAMMEERSKW